MDIDRALRLWKEAAVYRKFLRKFVRDYRQCVGEMQGSERAHARARAHKLRGAAGSLVLEGIFQAAKALEYSLAGGLPVEGAYTALQQALDDALLQIQAYAGEEPESEPATPADRERLRQVLQLALQRLEEDSPSAVEPVLVELATLLPAPDLRALRDALESFAFEAGKGAVRLLAEQHRIELED